MHIADRRTRHSTAFGQTRASRQNDETHGFVLDQGILQGDVQLDRRRPGVLAYPLWTKHNGIGRGRDLLF